MLFAALSRPCDNLEPGAGAVFGFVGNLGAELRLEFAVEAADDSSTQRVAQTVPVFHHAAAKNTVLT